MIDVGVHDLDESTYHADPCAAPSLSSSIAKVLLFKSPLHARYCHPKLNPQHQSEEKDRKSVV